MKKEALRVLTTVPAAPTTLYLAWLNAEQHSAMTGATAKIDSQVGGSFTAWNGYISGKLVILDLGRRIVANFRTTDFAREETDSRVEIVLEALGGGTRVTILHTQIPEGHSAKYRELWNEKYFTPMRTFFSKFLPDPRLPPPPRRPIPPEDDEDEEPAAKPAPKSAKAAAKPAPPSKRASPPAPPSKVAVKPSKQALPSKAKVAPKGKPARPSKPSPPKAKPKAKAPVKKAPAKSSPKKTSKKR